jgi:hypothetical protein
MGQKNYKKLKTCWRDRGRLGVWSWPTIGTNKMGGEKCPNCAWSMGFGKV